MEYILAAIGVPFALYFGYCFVQGFVRGFVEGWNRPPRPKFHRLQCLRGVCVSQDGNSRA
jgi:hypothetical protein